jgi:monoamine oxidase
MTHSKSLSNIRLAIKSAIYLNKHKNISFEELSELKKQKTSSRRDFLKTSLVVAGGLVLPVNQAFARNKLTPKVVVVGAGISGLNAAYKLKKAGIKADIYEASKRAGGRILSVKNLIFKDSVTEFGAEFIDSGHTEMHKLVKEFNFELIDVQKLGERDYKDTYFFGNKIYKEEDLVKEIIPFADKLSQDFKYYENEDFEMLKKFDTLSIAEYLKKIGISGWLYDMLDVAYCTDFGADITEQSAINFIDFAEFKDNNEDFLLFGESDERFKVKGGNQKIVDELHNRVKEQVKFEQELEAISDSGASYKLSFRSSNGSVSQVKADYIVLAIPISSLKNIAFKVEFNPYKKKAIKEIPMGKNNKFFASFKDKPWRTKKLNGNLYTDEFFQCSWEHTRLQESSLAGYTFFLGGSRTTMAKYTPEQTESFVQDLDKVYKGAKDLYLEPKGYTDWCNNPYFKGSFSVFLKGQALDLADELRKPVGNIFFAGEQTSAEDNGYMNGGAETGKISAEAIIKRIKY